MFTPVRSDFPPFRTTMSVTVAGTPPAPALIVMWNTHCAGVVEIPVLVAAVMIGTSFTPACPTRTCTLVGAAAFGAHLVALSVTATCAWPIRLGVVSMNGKTAPGASPVRIAPCEMKCLPGETPAAL
jgi:hypothetical protein